MDRQDAIIYQFPMSARMPQMSEGTGATEEAGARRTDVDASIKAESGSRDFLETGRQKFPPEAFKNPDVAPIIARFLIDDCEKYAQEKHDLRDQMEEMRKKNEVLTKQNTDQLVEIATLNSNAKISKVNEILYVVSMAIGSVGLGAAQAFSTVEATHDVAVEGMILFAVLIIGSLILRAWAIFQ